MKIVVKATLLFPVHVFTSVKLKYPVDSIPRIREVCVGVFEEKIKPGPTNQSERIVSQ